MALFYQNLIRIRKSRRISQEKLSEMSGIAQSAISMIEANQRSPSEQTMTMIAAALGVPLSNFFSDGKHEPSFYDTLTTETERQLISDFRQLNRQGREMILQQMDMVKKIYGQPGSIPMVENE